MKKLRKPLFYGPVLFFIIGIPAALFYGKNYVENRLEKGLQYADFNINAQNFNLDINFTSIRLNADTLLVESDQLKCVLAGVKGSLNIFQSSLTSIPFLKLQIDSSDLVLMPVEKKTVDSSEFVMPEVRAPRSIVIELGALRVNFNEKYHGAKDIRLESFTPSHVKVSVKNLQTEFLDLKPDVDLEYHQKRGKGIKLSAAMTTPSDSLELTAHFTEKKRILNRVNTRFNLMGLKALPQVQKIAGYLPETLEGKIELSLDTLPELHLSLKGDFKLVEIPGLPGFELASQKILLEVDVKGEDTKINFDQNGSGGEQVSLELDTRQDWKNVDLKNIKSQLEKMKFNISGFGKNLDWPLGGEILPLDFQIKSGKLSGTGFSGQVITRDGSDIHGQVAWAPEFTAEFSGDVSPRETWAIAWTDTNVYFENGFVSAHHTDGELTIALTTKKTLAYGARGDSVHAWLRINKSGLIMDSAFVFWDNIPWDVTGEVNWLPEDQDLKWVVSHPQYGTATYMMPDFNSMSVSASQVQLSKSPYRTISNLYGYQPLATGVFQWNFKEQFGMSDVNMDLNIRGNHLSAALESKWTPEEFLLTNLSIKRGKESLDLYGKVMMEEKPFYDIYKMKFTDLRELHLGADAVNMAPWVRMFKDSVILSLVLDGGVRYRPETGFTGNLGISDISIPATGDLLKITRGNLAFNNMDITLTANSESDELNILNDSISLTVGNFLDRTSTFSAAVILNNELKVRYSGELQEFSGLSGNLTAQGNLTLPEKSGRVTDASLKGMFTVPLSKRSSLPLLFVGRLSSARYAYDRMIPLKVSSDVNFDMQGFKFKGIDIVNATGQSLKGEGYYQIPKSLDFSLTGPEFDVKMKSGARIHVKNIKSRFAMTPDLIQLTVKAGQGNYNTRDDIVDISFDFAGSTIYRLPLGDHKRFQHQSLAGDIHLANFNYNHDTFGFANLKKLLRPGQKRKKVKRKENRVAMQVNVTLEGKNNVINTEFLNTAIEGKLNFSGVYPAMLVRGELNSLKGYFGFTSQSYNINEMNIKWGEVKMSEGEVVMVGQKTLAKECNNPESDSCYLELKLTGPLEKMEFTYDGTCGQELGQAVDPLVFLNSIGKGCFDPLNSRGAAAFAWAEGKVNQFATSKIQSFSGKTIKNFKVQGTQNLMRDKDDEYGSGASQVDDYSYADDAISIEIETAEKKGFKLKAKSGFIPYAETSPWEHEGGVEWHPTPDSVDAEDTWKNKFNIESTVKTSPPPQTELEEVKQDELRLQFGLNYNYDFWELW